MTNPRNMTTPVIPKTKQIPLDGHQRRVFKIRNFTRWMRKTRLTDEILCQAVTEMAQGLIDADLGGNLVKKRVALPGHGKSGSMRTLVATKRHQVWFFVFGFQKNERANISSQELKALQTMAADLLALSSTEMNNAVQQGKLQEICNGQAHTIH
jgi:hypothetical protein